MEREARWRKAQEAELAYWRTWRQLPVNRGFQLEAYWREQIELLGLEVRALTAKTVLDVGCGPVGIINFLPAIGPRWGIDPLFHRYSERIDLPEVEFCAGRGEHLPFRSASVDTVFCFNVLDHVADPRAVLCEVRRVLRPRGELYLMVHTFPWWLTGFLVFDRPHPHHWSRRDLRKLLERAGFLPTHEYHRPRSFDLRRAEYLRPSLWRYAAGSLVITSSYCAAQKRF